MIQRIQTVFLFLVAVAMILVVTFPIWQQVNPDQSQILTLSAWSLDKIDTQTQEVIQSDGNIYLGILAIIAAILALFSLTQYKNRTMQMFINMINSIVMVVTLALIIWTSHQANVSFNPEVNGAFMVGFWAIFGGMIMNLLANRFIRKDEMLVRSVDRIR
jgi:divalent metal cation (Fe/Co/Zn/Cd) transporter